MTINEFIGLIQENSREEFIDLFNHPFLILESIRNKTEEQYYKTIHDVSESGIALNARECIIYSVHKSDRNQFNNMITIGRTTNNDIIIEKSSVSKFHAYIIHKKKDNEFTISDAKSKYGTYINEKRIKPFIETPLKSGYKISFGLNIKLAFFGPIELYEYLHSLEDKSET